MAIELLMVMSIIMVLFVLYWGGGFGPAGKKKKQRQFAACAKNMQFVHTALLTYATDNNDKFPSVAKAQTSEAPLSLLIPKYISQTSPFICPSSGIKPLPEGEPFGDRRISYGYVMGLSRATDPGQFILSDEQIDTKSKPGGSRVFAATDDAPGNNHGHYGGNVILLDGSAQTIVGRSEIDLKFTNAVFLNPKPKPKKK